MRKIACERPIAPETSFLILLIPVGSQVHLRISSASGTLPL